MPELPEVETTRRGIAPHVCGHPIQSVTIRQHRLRWPIPNDLADRLTGQTIHQILRRSKYLLFDCGTGWLIMHLGMSGSLRIVTDGAAARKHDHLDIVFANDSILRLHDPRRFGACIWEPANVWQHPLLASLGPEPLDSHLRPDHLFNATRRRQQAIKPVLMDNRILVGIGNIYANEALFLAHIHPQTSASSLDAHQCILLQQAIQTTLTAAIRLGGSTLRDYVNGHGNTGYFQLRLQVYGREGQPCRVCGTPIQQIRQAQRASYFCPHCQH